MLSGDDTYNALRAIFRILAEVIFFWQPRLVAWLKRLPPKDSLLRNLGEARVFEEWEEAAYQLDELLGNDVWRQNPSSTFYDYRFIYERLQGIIDAHDEGDILGLVNILRSGLVRNLGNITAPQLYSRALVGTKLLIEEYVTEVAVAIEHVAAYQTTDTHEGGLTSQAKLDLLHDTRQAFGRSALILQGGAIFGLCHIGVVKALHLRGLLPRIIAGSATGALIAALVGVHTEDELLDFLTGERIDLTAFASRARYTGTNKFNWFSTIWRRLKRLFTDGYLLDINVLEQCVRANVGDMTFEEAYLKTKKVLNITVSTGRDDGVPSLLNYLTAPHVLIWSAAVASQSSSGPLYSPVTLLCKDPSNRIVPWFNTTANAIQQHHGQQAYSPNESMSTIHPADMRDSPLSRIAELFNVNHFVVSQARPYIAPFLQSGDVLSNASPRQTTGRRRGKLWAPLLRICVLEIQHRLRQFDALGLLRTSVRRFVVDDNIPGTSLTLVPELNARDFIRLLDRPTKKTVEEWIIRGERSVWPAIGALKVRCAIEVELDRAYQVVRRRKPMDAAAERQRQ